MTSVNNLDFFNGPDLKEVPMPILLKNKQVITLKKITEDISQSILLCDKEIHKWITKKNYMKDRFKKTLIVLATN